MRAKAQEGVMGLVGHVVARTSREIVRTDAMFITWMLLKRISNPSNNAAMK